MHEIVDCYSISSSERERKESKSWFHKENNTRSHNSNFSILDGRSKLLPSYSFVDFLLQYVGIRSQPEALHSILRQYAGNPGQHACKSWQHARNSSQCATNSWQCATDSCQSTSHPWPYASNTCIQWLAYASIWQNGKYHTTLVNQQHICILSMLNDKYTKEKTDLHFK